ncbi:MAG: sigma-54-dependent Fis family transcriptional regulator [Gammaproteobacteria bacterium]|nr:MAG: sigma-54-dependent Fis family transcriptional regulator [Gammaproteobacteria bacterium]
MNEVTPLPILVVEDDAALREAMCDTLGFAGYRALAAGDAEEALALLGREAVALLISDVHMPGADGHQLLREARRRRPELPVVLVTGYGTVQHAVAAIRDGAADYLQKPFDADALLAMTARLALRPVAGAGELLAEDPRSRSLAELASRIAAADVTVLITGESGTGKEVFARFIHARSARAGGPFVAINCAAIPENMLEAVLFGHEKGAFTGAHQARAGKFEQAQGGTLLLDEVSEMDSALQAKLLRVLQEREVERIGGRHPVALDVRVIATSNRRLRDEVTAGRFREDLYYRLHVMPLVLPPLRERKGDVIPLAERALRRATPPGAMPLELAASARAALLAHDWPGNVRELDNLMQRAQVLARGRSLEAADLVFEGAGPGAAPALVAAADPEVLVSDLRDHERRLIIEAIGATGSRKGAARRLGISPRTLRHKLQRMRAAGLEVPPSRA